MFGGLKVGGTGEWPGMVELRYICNIIILITKQEKVAFKVFERLKLQLNIKQEDKKTGSGQN